MMKKRENAVNINEDRGVILVNKNIKIINQKHKIPEREYSSQRIQEQIKVW